MLQRIQSIYLLLAAACAGATWFFPVRTWTTAAGSPRFLTRGLFNSEGMELADASLPMPYHIVLSLIAAVFVVCVFLYGNRIRQGRVVRAAWLMLLLVGVLQYITCNSMDAYLVEGVKPDGRFGPSLFLPFVSIIFALLAERALKKDEALVKSADRLR